MAGVAAIAPFEKYGRAAMRSRLLPIALFFGTLLSAANGATLEEEFRSPPNTARLWVYWTQSGHNSVESATADLEAMKKAGIGGVLRMDCSVGQVPGGSPFLGEKWRKQFVHSVHECERLGLEFTTITGPGWTGTGGPWISADQSMQHLVPASVTTKGPAEFDQVLPLPQPRISKYHRHQTPQMQKQISEFYQDVALFAFPRRVPVIADIQEKALHIRNPFTSMPGVRPHLPSPADHPAATAAQVINPKDIIDLTGKLQADGRLTWDVPPGEWTIVRLGARSTGANTRPAPPAGLGLESDKFSKQALTTHFEAYFDPLLEKIGPRPIDRKTGYVALDADSWEMSSQNWTPGFREEFKQRRGYDPWLYFTTYTGCVVGSREQTERFLWDIRKTCQELLLENHAAELKEMCHQRGLRLMIEPYDMNPAGDLDLGSYADFPAGEFWHDTFKSGWSCIAASSIAHTMGKPIVLAEGFTSGRGNWARSPWTLKNQTDWAFAIGINKFAIHGFAHQVDESAPGFTFGPYGVFWNRKQTFWPMVGAYHDYLARCSYLLQQGVTVSDILYLTPEGTPQVFQPPASAMHDAAGRLPDKKVYSFDGCSPRILMDRAEVRDGRICFPGGTSYRLLVLPRWKTMTPALLAKIIRLVESGATVLGAPPISSPSLSDYPQCDARVKQLAETLWGKAPYTQERVLGKGRVLLDSAAPQLAQKDIAEDVPLLPSTGRWIWYAQGNPAKSAPAGDVHFRYSWDIGDKSRLEKAVVEATADNSFTLQVNGNQMLAGDNFHEIYLADINSALKSGQNEITVTANNFGPDANPAGLITAIRLAFVDGTTKVIGTDANWSASRDKTNWSAAKELGDASMAPWHLGAGNTKVQMPNGLYPDYTTTSALLAGQGVPEDFQADAPLRYTHRRTEDREIYFVSNRSDQALQSDCTFRVAGGQPELWDPVSGERRPLPQYQNENGRTMIPMQFEPRESFFVVFPRGDSSGSNKSIAGGVNFPKATSVATLEGSWEVSFDPRWGGPEKVTFDAPQDWTGRKEEGIKYYSGIATYRKSFDRPAELPTDSRIYLDLGTVHEIARVNLNGKDFGVVWCAPWRIDISTALKPGKNGLEIEVANLWPNRLIGDAALPPEKRFTVTNVQTYKKDSTLLESGLLGPVTLQKVIP
jgi:hypothetical protein